MELHQFQRTKVRKKEKPGGMSFSPDRGDMPLSLISSPALHHSVTLGPRRLGLGLGPRRGPRWTWSGGLITAASEETEGWCLAAESPPTAWRWFWPVEAEDIIHQEPSGRQSEGGRQQREATVIKLPAGPEAESCWKLGLWVKKKRLLREIWQMAELKWRETLFNFTVFVFLPGLSFKNSALPYIQSV